MSFIRIPQLDQNIRYKVNQKLANPNVNYMTGFYLVIRSNYYQKILSSNLFKIFYLLNDI